MKEKSTLTIAIPAYNEEVTIEHLIRSLLNQENHNFVLEHIVVYSDASTDRTHEIVLQLGKEYSEVLLRQDDQRLGKYLRMSQAFGECRSDYLVVLDADIMPVGNRYLDTLVEAIQTDHDALMVAGHNILQRPATFIGKIIYTNFLLWDNVRWSLENIHCAENFYGTATIFRGSFAQTIHIPPTVSDPHLYIFLKADEQNGFRYCTDAHVLQWPITTLKDFNKFLRRTLGKEDPELRRLFGDKIDTVYGASIGAKLSGLLKTFRVEPLFLPFALLLILYSKFQLRFLITNDQTAVWSIVTSTKKEL